MMGCFADLYARFPEKVMELCVEECSYANRPYCFLPDTPPWQDVCVLCPRLAYDDGAPGGWHEMKLVCEDEQCQRLWVWIEARGKGSGGTTRRQVLKKHFGKTILEVEHGVRREAILTTMLLVESLEKASAGKKRLRVAA